MSDTVSQQREIFFRGQVQGVGFRYTTRRIAARFAVVGVVENLSDGRVRVVVEGDPAELDRFLAAVDAEMGWGIEDKHVTTRPAGGEFRQFAIRF